MKMATGKTPFGGGSTADVFAALLRENPPPVSKLNPAMPRKLDPIRGEAAGKGRGGNGMERRGAAGSSGKIGCSRRPSTGEDNCNPA